MAKNKPTNKKKMSGPRIAALIVTIAILLGLVVSLLAGSGFFIRIQNGAKTENFKVNGSMMAYYSYTYVNNWMSNYYIYVLYGMFNPTLPFSEQIVPGETGTTFKDYFATGTKSMVTQYLNYCEAALADPDFEYEKVKADAEAYAKQTENSIKASAKASGMSTDAYLRQTLNTDVLTGQLMSASFGEYVNMSDLKKAMVIEYIAGEYANFVYDRYDTLTDNAREDRYFKEHFEEFFSAEYIVYTVSAPETVDPKNFTLGKDDPKYKEAVEKAKNENFYAKAKHEENLKTLAEAAKNGLDAYKKAFLELKYDEVFDSSYKTLVKNWAATDKPSDEVLKAFKEEIKSQIIDAILAGKTTLDEDEVKDDTATVAEESNDETDNSETTPTTKPTKWETATNTFPTTLISDLKKVLTDSTVTVKYTLETDLGKYLFTEVKKNFIDENATVESGTYATLYDTWQDEAEMSEDDKAINKYSISQYFVTKMPEYETYQLRNVGHILFKIDTAGEYKTSDEAKAAAEKLLAELQAKAVDGVVPKDVFETVAKEHTDDVNVFYDDVIKGQMVTNFDEFLFSAEKAGDMKVVYGESSSYKGWHIVYYVGEAEDQAWRKNAHSGATSEDLQAWYDGLNINIVINDGIFDDILS